LSLFFLAVFIVIGWVVFVFFYERPTCFDGVHNSDEEGIDCGGSCERVCSFQAIEPIVLWSRFMEVVPGVYSVVALIENPNANTSSLPVEYSFKLRDQENILLYERKGEVALPPQQQVPIFESNIIVGDNDPARIFFEFTEDIEWKRDSSARPELRVRGTNLENEDKSPRLTASIVNVSRDVAQNVGVVAIIFDLDGNAMAASETVIDFLGPDEEAPLIFTWPRGFDKEVSEILIIPSV